MIQPAETPPRRPANALRIAAYALLLIIAWTGLELWGLDKTPFHTKGEPREGLVVWEMTHGGGWILPRRNGTELPSKPPLFHWLGAATSRLHGATDEWSIRFPSAALSLIALLGVFAAGSALWSARAGVIGGLALMTMFEWARAATNARVDMTLTFGLQLAFLSLLFFQRSRAAGWLAPLYIGISLAVLGKGPVGAVLPGLVTLVMVVLTRDLSLLRQLRLAYGALVVAVVAGSWYVMALVLGGWEFFRKQVLAENLFTFFDSAELGGGHRHPAPYLLGALLLGMLPWTLFFPGLLARLWRQRRQLAVLDARVYLLVWIAVVFTFYAVAASKRGVYLLALYPAMALLLGWWWNEQCDAPPEEERWIARLAAMACRALLAVLTLAFLAVLLERLGVPLVAVGQRWLPADAQLFAPWMSDTIHADGWRLLGGLLSAAAATCLCIRAARGPYWIGIFASLTAGVAAVLLAAQLVILPGLAPHTSLRGFMAKARDAIGPTGQLVFYKTFDYEAVFYWQNHIALYDGPWPAGAPRYLLMQQEEWERIRAPVENQYQSVTLSGADNLGEHGPLVLIRRVGEE